MNVHYLSLSNEWTTPQALYDELNAEFGFTLDPCSTHENAKCEKYYTVDDDGLSKSWAGETVFMNPPYGRQIGAWIKKAYDEAHGDATVVCLIPARTDTKAWHKYIFPTTAEVRFLPGRVRFGDGRNAAPFPSAIVIFRALP